MSDLDGQAAILYKHVRDMGEIKYENELRREDSLIQQSSHMQTAFSFMTAAIFMAVPIMIEHRGNLTLEFFLLSVSTIVACLLVSLVTASLAQRRVKKEALLDIEDIEKFVSDNWEKSLTDAQQLKQWVQVMGKVQKSLSTINESRVKLIRASMASFLISIGLIIFWYVIAIFKLF